MKTNHEPIEPFNPLEGNTTPLSGESFPLVIAGFPWFENNGTVFHQKHTT
jgi:hypothetical protein